MSWIIFIAIFWKESLHLQLPMPWGLCTTGSAIYCFVIQTHQVTGTTPKSSEFLFLPNFHILVCISNPTCVCSHCCSYHSVNKTRLWHKLKDWWITIPVPVQLPFTTFWVVPRMMTRCLQPAQRQSQEPNLDGTFLLWGVWKVQSYQWLGEVC